MMNICDMNATIGALNALLSHNPACFESLPATPKGEARVLGVDSQERGFRVLWTGAIKDIWSAPLEYEVKVQVKCLYHQSELRNDGCRGWSPVVFIITQGSEQSLHRILLKPGNPRMIAAIGGCDCKTVRLNTC
jgi:hypothetical protein